MNGKTYQVFGGRLSLKGIIKNWLNWKLKKRNGKNLKAEIKNAN